MADDQNRLDVAELMFFLLICDGIYATSIIPTTRLRMMWIARQVEEKLVSGCVEQLPVLCHCHWELVQGHLLVHKLYSTMANQEKNRLHDHVLEYMCNTCIASFPTFISQFALTIKG